MLLGLLACWLAVAGVVFLVWHVLLGVGLACLLLVGGLKGAMR